MTFCEIKKRSVLFLKRHILCWLFDILAIFQKLETVADTPCFRYTQYTLLSVASAIANFFYLVKNSTHEQ